MNSFGWLFFTARRWMNIKRGERSATSTILAVLGIALGVLTLYTVLGVMNGFQSGFIESILEIGSFHARIQVSDSKIKPAIEQIKSLKNVKSVLPFFETQDLVRGISGESLPVLTRGIPIDSQTRDPGFVSALNIIQGNLPRKANEILIGEELSFWLRVSNDDYVSLISIEASEEEGLIPVSKLFKVSGIFKSGYYEYDMARAFILYDLFGDSKNENLQNAIMLGIKFDDINNDISTVGEIRKKTRFEIESWRDYNKSFFGALKMEKNLMMIVIGLIFLVVSINIFHSLRRSVRERLEDIAILRAIGASSLHLRLVFVFEGLFIGLIGSTIGLLLGLLVTGYINELFRFVEITVNFFLAILNSFFGDAQRPDFALFSPTFFYLTNIPIRVYSDESIFIFALGLSSSTFAALFASKKTTSMAPQEVLRNE